MSTPVNPAAITAGDVCAQALQEAGAFGVGQVPTATDTANAWVKLQFMLQQWERKRWLIYHLLDKLVTSTGANSYTVGPSGNINTGVGSVRPNKLEAAYLRQLTQSQPNQIDYPLQILDSMEDYSRIAIKQLKSFPGAIFYDSGWPLGTAYPYPVPQASIYALHIIIREQLPVKFATLATVLSLPYEYYSAIIYNLALRLRPAYGLGTYPGDMLPGLARDALNVLRTSNFQIATLQVPQDLLRAGIYNIYSDRMY